MLQNIAISTFNNINILNNSIPQLILDSWQSFFINTLNTVNLSTVTTVNYLQMYLFSNNSQDIFNSELSGYYLLTIFTLIFGYLYIKPSVNYATFKLTPLSVRYLFFIVGILIII